ncbi:MAG: LysM peptidoglycan-binding domain-containing protein [Promicromonosporaceae bacterium]|nr:LysM peptidoglycan-binding domain-containing protein [Promicromonosporaceae bacterium]
MAATIACPSVPTAARPAHGPLGLGGLRLTRRGRVAVVVLALLLAAPLLGLGGRAVASGAGKGIEVTVHTVAPGETLWGYARQIAKPGQDVRDVVAELHRLNDLPSASLAVGQTILVPRG